MQKIKIILITIIAIVGAYLIYNHFEKIRQNEVVVDEFSSEYSLVSENNVFKYSNIDEILDILQNKTGIIFFCTNESNWCNHYASYLNEALINTNHNEVYYYNIMKDRQLNTIKYQKIIDILNPYIYKDDLNNSKLYMPDLTFVKDGQIVAHDNETSLVASDIENNAYWTHEKIQEFKNKIIEYTYLLNEE